ncbi:hypothetical protein T06_12236 [Trichinella sp. T6]|nr:hypothetical protein T06_12236 [Trichinella sp. T6]
MYSENILQRYYHLPCSQTNDAAFKTGFCALQLLTEDNNSTKKHYLKIRK